MKVFQILKPGNSYRLQGTEMQCQMTIKQYLREMFFETMNEGRGKKLLSSGDSSVFEIYTCLQGQMERNFLERSRQDYQELGWKSGMNQRPDLPQEQLILGRVSMERLFCVQVFRPRFQRETEKTKQNSRNLSLDR